MSVAPVIRKFLEDRGVPYEVRHHARAYTSQEVAAIRHVPGEEMAKNLVLKADGKLILGVLPASHVACLDRLKAAIGCHKLRLACEHEIQDQFFGCELGAAPPLGEIWDMPVYCDRTLMTQPEIEFSGGTHADTIRMRTADFERLVRPRILDFSVKRDGLEPTQHSAS